MKRYFRLLVAFAKNSLMRELEFKESFITQNITHFLWGFLNILYFGFIYGHVDNVSGWDINSVYILTATFFIVKDMIDSIFRPNLKRINELVIDGRLDFVLTKPVNSQFFISFRRYRPYEALRMIFSIYILYLVSKRAYNNVTLASVLFYVLFIIVALIITYSILFISVTLVFWLGRVNNIIQLYRPLLNFSRMPIDVYPKAVAFLFTFIIPIAFVASVPAKLLLGVFDYSLLIYGFSISLILLFISHKFWQISLRRYSSAGG